MGNWRESYDSGDFLKCDDLKGAAYILQISGVKGHKFDDGKSQIVLSFHNTQKALGLNKTNARMVSIIAGNDDTDAWINHRIKVFPCFTEYGNDITKCVRVCHPDTEPLIGHLETRSGMIPYPQGGMMPAGSTPAPAQPPDQVAPPVGDGPAAPPGLMDNGAEIPF
jgi:hypothetical protein